MSTCGACGEEIAARFRFCGVCGTPVSEQPGAQREVRKTVTVLFCDVVDSTRLGARLDPESLRQVMGRYFDVARAVIERHGGTVEKFIGDAVMGVFGVPTLHEDDALRATRAAAELREGVADLNASLMPSWGVELHLRMGVNTGEVIAGEQGGGQTLITGDAVNVAARLEQVAGRDEILLGPVTWTLVRDAVVAERVAGLELKGKDVATDAHRLVSVIPRVLGRTRRVDTPMVGRVRERRLLEQAFERSVADDGCHLFTVLGAAGVGKSRLVHDFLTQVRGEATVLRGRCLDYGEGITFWPLAEIARDAVGATESDGADVVRARLADLMGDDDPRQLVADRLAALVGGEEVASRADEVPWAVRKLLESLAASRPVVVVLDDLHWAEPTLLDLVEHVADWSRDAPILLLCIARPELLDARPGWAGGKMNATSILMEPLSSVESAELVANLLGHIGDGEAVRSRIAAVAEGNPFFVEELVAMLIDDGLLVRDSEQWIATSDLHATPIPPTISALLAARLDRLADQERAVIGRASVVGKTFYRTAVAELSSTDLRPDVASSLMALVRKELIRPDRSGPLGDDAFHFRHLLIRDAAYDAMPRRERAELHERLADWLETAGSGRLGQFEEILGYHLEQAHHQLIGLGVADQRVDDLARRGTGHLAAAGRRAVALADVPAAVALLERALALAPSGSRASVAADLAATLVDAGRLRAADDLLARTEVAPDDPAAPSLRLTRLQVQVLVRGPGVLDAVVAELPHVVAALELGRSPHDLVRGLHLMARLEWERGQVGEAERLMRRALAAARAAGDARHVGLALGQLGFYALLGPTRVDEAIDRCADLLEEAGDDRRLRASLQKTSSSLHALRGEFDLARQLADESSAVLADLGLRLDAAQAAVEFAIRELAAGDPLAAEAIAREGFEVLQAMGETSYMCNCAAVLAQALSVQGLHHEAARFAAISERTTDDHDVGAQLQWRAARARVLTAEGRNAQAVELARSAVELSDGTDMVLLQADAWYEYAQALHAAGRPAEAVQAARTALELYVRKGATAVAVHARTLLDVASERLPARGPARI